MQMTHTRAPQALPAVIAGVAAVLLSFVLGPLIVCIAAAAALSLAGMALADVKSHGYTGEGFAIAGIILGVAAIALNVIGLIVA
jgi:hypothetical protein